MVDWYNHNAYKHFMAGMGMSEVLSILETLIRDVITDMFSDGDVNIASRANNAEVDILEAVGTWIKVEDKLPKHNGHVFVITTLPSGTVVYDIGIYQPTRDEWTTLVRKSYSKYVSHWKYTE